MSSTIHGCIDVNSMQSININCILLMVVLRWGQISGQHANRPAQLTRAKKLPCALIDGLVQSIKQRK